MISNLLVCQTTAEIQKCQKKKKKRTQTQVLKLITWPEISYPNTMPVEKKRPRQASLQKPLLSITCKTPNSESFKLTLPQQLRVQQASRQITACDHDRANNPAPGSSEYHMIKHWGVARLCQGVACQRQPMWLHCLCPLRNADKARQHDPLSSLGSAHERRFIKTYVKRSCGWLRAWYPLLWSSLDGGMGGRQGGSSLWGLQHSELQFTATGSGRVEPLHFLIKCGGTGPKARDS